MTGAASIFPRASDRCALLTAHSTDKLSPSAGRWVLTATVLGSAIAGIDGTVVNVALPTMQKSFQATAADLQWVIEGYSLFLSALILVGGSLGDRLGRRRVFEWGLIIFTLASVGCGFAPSIGFLVAARCIQGVGGALLVPGSLAIISASYDEASRGKAIGTWSGFSSMALAIGPLLGGWLVQTASWRWAFFINVPIAAVTLVLSQLHVPESRDDEITGPLDWLGAVLVTLGLGGVVFGLIEAGRAGPSDPWPIVSFVVGVVLLVGFVVAEARSPAPMMPLDVFRSRTFTGANLLTLLLYGALGGSLYFFPFVLQQVHGYSPAAAGAALLPFTIIVFTFSRWTGGLVPRFGAKLPLIVGPLITAAGFALFAIPGSSGSYWTTFFPAVVVMSSGMTLVITPLTTAVMNSVSERRSGVASGVNNAVSRAAGLLAIAVFGLVVASVFGTQLDSRLASLQVSPTVMGQMDAQKAKLVGATIPPDLSVRETSQVHQALDDSFVDGFRAAMLLAAALAVISSVFAAWLIEGKAPESSTVHRDEPEAVAS